MHAVITPDTFAGAINGVSQLVDEAIVEVSDTGISTSAVDPSNVGMVEMSLSEGAFESLNADGERLGVNINRLSDTVSQLRKEMTGDSEKKELHLKIDEETRQLELWCEPGTMSYSLSLIDPDSIRDEPDIPDINVASEITLNTDYFDNVVRTASQSFDHMAVGTTNDAVTFDCQGDIDDFTVKANENDFPVYQIDSGNVESIYSLDYFNDIRKGLPNDEEMVIEVGNDFPITLQSEYENGSVEIMYLIAPRVEDDN